MARRFIYNNHNVTTYTPSIPVGPIVYLDPTTYTSGTWNDQSGNGLNFTLRGGFTFNSGTSGGVMYSTGASGAYADRASNALFSNYSTGFTYVLWLKPDTPGTNKGFIAFDNTTIRRVSTIFWPNLTTQNVNIWYTNSGGTATATSHNQSGMTNGAWQMLTVTFDAINGTSSSYIDNGSNVVSVTLPTKNNTCMVSNTAPFWIGCHYNTSTCCKGYYGHVLWYNRSLTPAEIQSLYDFTKAKYGKT